jgi:hypothetical protein
MVEMKVLVMEMVVMMIPMMSGAMVMTRRRSPLFGKEFSRQIPAYRRAFLSL